MPYDVAKRFQEVAKRARETGPVINAAPKKKPTGFGAKTAQEADDAEAFRTRPGAKSNRRGDVNLPLSGASPEVKKRLGMK